MKSFWSKSTIKRLSASAFAVSVLTVMMSQSALAATKVVGYIPAYKDMVAVANTVDFHKLTHVNLAFLSPNTSGAVAASNGNPVCMPGAGTGNVTTADIGYVVQKAHDAGAKVLVSLAGAGTWDCAGVWTTLLQPAKRTTLVNNLIKFVNDNNLDGIDVDIEGDVLTAIDNAGNYTPFIQALKTGLGAKLVTSATGSYDGGMVPISSLPYFDFVNIMSYDAIGPTWGDAGVEHSTYQMAVDDINIWKARGLSKDKLVLGVPAYGYGFDGYAADYDYTAIIGTFGASAAQKDLIGTLCAGCMYITYNGLPTIRKKTQLALQQGSGVMIWELAADTKDNTSILSAVVATIGGTSSSSSSSSANCPAWVDGHQYYTGNVVSYMGGYYIAEHDNPGYTPTISTWFWDPVNASQCGVAASSVAQSSVAPSSVAKSSVAPSSVAKSSVAPSSSSKSSSAANCQVWVDGHQYYTGNVVSYMGGYYIAEHDNPGYTPTISTWFWDPVSASQCGGAASSVAKSSVAPSSVAKSSVTPSSVAKSSVAPSSTPKSSVAPSTPKSSEAPSSIAKSSSSTGGSGTNLDNAAKKDVAMQIVSSAENSTTNWRAQFSYIEDIKDGRGYTAGIIGFCSGTSDMLQLVENYSKNYPNNGLAKYLPALRKVDGSASHAGLDPNYPADWAKEAGVAAFQAAQEKERDDIYFNPSVAQGKADGIRALGQFAYYDAAVVHGFDGMMSVRARALKKAKTPAQGGNEVTYLNAFLDERVVEMLKEEAHSDTSRIDTAQRVFLNNGNLDLNTPLSWKVYGDSFSTK